MSSTYTPITLTGLVASLSNRDLYAEIDGTGLQGQYKTFDLTISSITSQNHGDGSTREPNLYNGIDIEAGMWVSDDSGDIILKITSIESKSEVSIVCVVEDVDMLSYRLRTNNTLGLNGSVYIFRTNIEGEAILATSAGFLTGAIDSIQSRFQLNERDDRVKFEHSSAPSVNEGDVVTINSTGSLVPLNDVTAASTIKIGTVLEKLRSGKDIYVKPFNDIIVRYKNPELLTGNPGDTYYSDLNNPGEITTLTGGNATFLQLNTVIATEVLATNSNLPGSIDIIEINKIKIFDGPDGDTVANLGDLVTLINNNTSQTDVVASTYTSTGSVSSNDNSLVYQGAWALNDVFIPIGIVGQTPSSFAEITISDGVNLATIIFDTPGAVVNFGDDYDVMTPTAILAEFQAAITTNSLNLVASLIDVAVGKGIKIETTGDATGITITNVSNDAFGNPAAGAGSSIGLDLTATLGASVLKLVRSSGGDIIIDGSPLSGGYINQGGIVSSNSGRVPYLLMLEGVADGGGTTEVGVETDSDLNQTPNVTSIDGNPTGVFITYTPFSDSNVQILVNGISINLGHGFKNKPCYFSADGGVTARLIADIEAGDQLYWNGSIAGYELDTTDDIDISYQKSSLD
jgi:hypothetical protein